MRGDGWGNTKCGAAIQLRLAEERYALAVRGANDGLWDWNLQTDEIYYSPRWKAMLGYRETEIDSIPDAWFSRINEADGQRVRDELQAHFSGNTPYFESEFRMKHKDGRELWVLCRGLHTQEDGEPEGRMAGSLTDITARKIAEDKLLHNAFYDSLTGLAPIAPFL